MRLRGSASKVIRRRKAKNLTKTTWSVTIIQAPVLPFVLFYSPQPDLKPIVEKDIPKVVQAMRQTQSRKVLYKLLTRVKVCFASSILILKCE